MDTKLMTPLLGLLVVGCREPYLPTAEAVLTYPTVVRVSWADDQDLEPTEQWIEFGPDSSYGQVAPARCTEGQCETLLLGLTPAATWHWRLVLDDGQGALTGEDQTITTEGKPSTLPDLALTVFDESRMPAGYIVTSLIGANGSATAILNTRGEYVFWQEVSAEDFYATRAIWDPVGQIFSSLRYLPTFVAEGQSTPGNIVRTNLADQSEETISVLDMHHDFTQLPDGNLATLVHELLDVDGRRVIGDRIVELTPEGEQIERWSAFDDLPYDPDADVRDELAYHHANAIDYDSEKDTFYVSLRNFNGIYGIERLTGNWWWTFGGTNSDYVDETGESLLFIEQHQFQVFGDHVLVFDNQQYTQVPPSGIEFLLDDEEGLATEIWRHNDEDILDATALGDVQRLPSGDTMVTFSSSGQIDMVGADEQTIMSINSDFGAVMGYATWMESLYPVQ